MTSFLPFLYCSIYFVFHVGRQRGPETDSIADDDDGSMASLGHTAEVMGARSAEAIAAAAMSASDQQHGMYGQRPSAASSRGQRGYASNNDQMSRQQELESRRQNLDIDDDGEDDDGTEDDDEDDDEEDDEGDMDQEQFIG